MCSSTIYTYDIYDHGTVYVVALYIHDIYHSTICVVALYIHDIYDHSRPTICVVLLYIHMIYIIATICAVNDISYSTIYVMIYHIVLYMCSSTVYI